MQDQRPALRSGFPAKVSAVGIAGPSPRASQSDLSVSSTYTKARARKQNKLSPRFISSKTFRVSLFATLILNAATGCSSGHGSTSRENVATGQSLSKGQNDRPFSILCDIPDRIKRGENGRIHLEARNVSERSYTLVDSAGDDNLAIFSRRLGSKDWFNKDGVLVQKFVPDLRFGCSIRVVAPAEVATYSVNFRTDLLFKTAGIYEVKVVKATLFLLNNDWYLSDSKTVVVYD